MARSFVLLLSTAALLVFAWLQVNDPDPEIWIPLYALPALLCAWAAFRPLYHWVPGLLATGYLIGALLLWPEQYYGVTGTMAEHHEIELARESLGLIIAAACMLFYYLPRSAR